MKKTVILLVTMLLFATSTAQAEINKAWLDNRVQTFIKDKPVNGLIYGLWINGKAVSMAALGESMTAVPATKAMHFRIGGVTETMLSTLLMQLVEQKKLKLSSKVAQWFPDLPNAKEVSLKMLANGTSGYPDYVYNKEFDKVSTEHTFKQWTEKELLDYAFMEPPSFAPGTSQHYSHTDYVILGSILAKVAEKPLQELLQTNILEPLAMKQTQFNLTAPIPSPVLHSFTNIRSVFEDATFWDPSWTSYSGSTVSVIKDLGIWGNTWMRGSLISPESTKELRAPDTVGKGTNQPDHYFAMGFIVLNHWLVQNPSFGGYSGVFAVLPEKNLVFIAYNTLNAEAKTNENYSVALFQELAAELAPDFPLPKP